jgi:hypothetical protein
MRVIAVGLAVLGLAYAGSSNAADSPKPTTCAVGPALIREIAGTAVAPQTAVAKGCITFDLQKHDLGLLARQGALNYNGSLRNDADGAGRYVTDRTAVAIAPHQTVQFTGVSHLEVVTQGGDWRGQLEFVAVGRLSPPPPAPPASSTSGQVVRESLKPTYTGDPGGPKS